MDSLQDKIKTMNALCEIPKGHQQRFENKLRHELHQSANKKRISVYYAIAASAAILVCLYLFTFNNIITKPVSLLARYNGEIAETEQFLQNEIAQRIAKIEMFENHKGATTSIINDLKENDRSLKILKKDLDELPGDQRIIDAIINTYLLKIETLDNIVNILQKQS